MSSNSVANLLLPGYALLKLGRLHPENLIESSLRQRVILGLYLLPLTGTVLMCWYQMFYSDKSADAFAENLFAVGAFMQVRFTLSHTESLCKPNNFTKWGPVRANFFQRLYRLTKAVTWRLFVCVVVFRMLLVLGASKNFNSGYLQKGPVGPPKLFL